MDKLLLKPTNTTPYVCFDPENKRYEISGHSCPEIPNDVFIPVIEWINNNLPILGHTLFITINADYFNSASNRLLLKIFRVLEVYYKSGKDIRVEWQYEDDEIQNDGLIYENLVNIPFDFRNMQ